MDDVVVIRKKSGKAGGCFSNPFRAAKGGDVLFIFPDVKSAEIVFDNGESPFEEKKFFHTKSTQNVVSARKTVTTKQDGHFTYVVSWEEDDKPGDSGNGSGDVSGSRGG